MLYINYAAVFAAGVASMVFMFLWHGVIFKNFWMKIQGLNAAAMNQDKSGMIKNYAFEFISSLVTAFALAFFIKIFGIVNVKGALVLSLWIWLGFYATTMLSGVLWDKKPWSVYFVNIGYYFLNVYLMSLVLTFWQ